MIRLAESFCCTRCFSYRSLKRYILEHGTTRGRCGYCKARNVHVIEIGQLTDAFQNFMDLFIEEAESLDTLAFYAAEWGVFNERRLDENGQIDLFNEIVNAHWDDDDGESPIDAAEYYRSRRSVGSEWDDFCEEVRLDPRTPLPFNELMQEELDRRNVVILADSTFFRARLGCEQREDNSLVPYSGLRIGAPRQTRKSGRAHRASDRVLYTADQEATCVAEVRPARGMYASICTVTTNRDLRIVDLSLPGNEVDPFFIEEPHYHMGIEALMTALGEEMGKPLGRDDDETHYIPSQVLAGFIRGSRYDGIRYPSALRPRGANVVFFDPAVVSIGRSRLVRVTQISLAYTGEQ